MTQQYLWILDNGHAPETAGKRSPKLPDGCRLLEWEFARDVVDRIAAQLDGLGIAYHVLTPRTNHDMKPSARCALANLVASKSNLKSRGISVHANAFGNGRTFNDSHGVTVLYYPRSRVGKKMALDLQVQLVKHSGLRDRRLIERTNVTILKQTSMPFVLSECGFYTNQDEAELLMSGKGRQMFADAHVAFIKQVEAAR